MGALTKYHKRLFTHSFEGFSLWVGVDAIEPAIDSCRHRQPGHIMNQAYALQHEIIAVLVISLLHFGPRLECSVRNVLM